MKSLLLISLLLLTKALYSLTVSNAVIPLNSIGMEQINSFIVFSNHKAVIGSQQQRTLEVNQNTRATIITVAPACNRYIGYSCISPIPERCFVRNEDQGLLMISAVSTIYGIHPTSIRCAFVYPPNYNEKALHEQLKRIPVRRQTRPSHHDH